MSHIQDVAEAYREPISRFIDAAERYCSLIEAWDEDAGQFGSPRDFLQRVEPLLAELYLRALGLPDADLLLPDEEDEEPSNRTGSCARRFPGLAHYARDDIGRMQKLACISGIAATISPYSIPTGRCSLRTGGCLRPVHTALGTTSTASTTGSRNR